MAYAEAKGIILSSLWIFILLGSLVKILRMKGKTYNKKLIIDNDNMVIYKEIALAFCKLVRLHIG